MATTSEHAGSTETRTTTVQTGGDVNSTGKDVDDIFSQEAVGAFFEKKGVNLETGERTTPTAPPARERKEATPATPEQKEELESMLEGGPVKKKAPKEEPKAEPEVKPETKPDVKPEPKPEVKPEVKSEPKAKPDFKDLSDEGINREVADLKTGKQETKERYASLLRTLKEEREAGNMTKKEFDAAKTELAKVKKDYEEAAKRPNIPEEVVKQQQAERDELSMFRRQYQLERDPEVKKAFDDQVIAVEETIAKSLAEAGVPEKAVELIKNTGGWAAFSRSKKPISWTEVDENGENVTRKGTHADYAERVTKALSQADIAAIQARVGKQVLIRDQKELYIAQEKAKASDYFKKVEETMKSATEAQKKQFDKLKTDYESWAEKTAKESDWLKDSPVPDKATKEERAAIEAENAHNATVREYIKKGREATSFEDYTKFVERGAKGLKAELHYEPLKSKAAELEKRVADLTAELAKVRNGNRSVPTKGSLTGTGALPQNEKPKTKANDNVEDILGDLEKFALERSRE